MAENNDNNINDMVNFFYNDHLKDENIDQKEEKKVELIKLDDLADKINKLKRLDISIDNKTGDNNNDNIIPNGAIYIGDISDKDEDNDKNAVNKNIQLKNNDNSINNEIRELLASKFDLIIQFDAFFNNRTNEAYKKLNIVKKFSLQIQKINDDDKIYFNIILKRDENLKITGIDIVLFKKDSETHHKLKEKCNMTYYEIPIDDKKKFQLYLELKNMNKCENNPLRLLPYFKTATITKDIDLFENIDVVKTFMEYSNLNKDMMSNDGADKFKFTNVFNGKYELLKQFIITIKAKDDVDDEIKKAAKDVRNAIDIEKDDNKVSEFLINIAETNNNDDAKHNIKEIFNYISENEQNELKFDEIAVFIRNIKTVISDVDNTNIEKNPLILNEVVTAATNIKNKIDDIYKNENFDMIKEVIKHMEEKNFDVEYFKKNINVVNNVINVNNEGAKKVSDIATAIVNFANLIAGAGTKAQIVAANIGEVIKDIKIDTTVLVHNNVPNMVQAALIDANNLNNAADDAAAVSDATRVVAQIIKIIILLNYAIIANIYTKVFTTIIHYCKCFNEQKMYNIMNEFYKYATYDITINDNFKNNLISELNNLIKSRSPSNNEIQLLHYQDLMFMLSTQKKIQTEETLNETQKNNRNELLKRVGININNEGMISVNNDYKSKLPTKKQLFDSMFTMSGGEGISETTIKIIRHVIIGMIIALKDNSFTLEIILSLLRTIDIGNGVHILENDKYKCCNIVFEHDFTVLKQNGEKEITQDSRYKEISWIFATILLGKLLSFKSKPKFDRNNDKSLKIDLGQNKVNNALIELFYIYAQLTTYISVSDYDKYVHKIEKRMKSVGSIDMNQTILSNQVQQSQESLLNQKSSASKPLVYTINNNGDLLSSLQNNDEFSINMIKHDGLVPYLLSHIGELKLKNKYQLGGGLFHAIENKFRQIISSLFGKTENNYNPEQKDLLNIAKKVDILNQNIITLLDNIKNYYSKIKNDDDKRKKNNYGMKYSNLLQIGGNLDNEIKTLNSLFDARDNHYNALIGGLNKMIKKENGSDKW
jgi:hypothetical protein